MKVKDIINSQFDLTDTEVNFIVKPKGTEKKYYDSNVSYLRDEVAEMEVTRWMICDAKRKKCTFVIIVEEDKKYEEDRKRAYWNVIDR